MKEHALHTPPHPPAPVIDSPKEKSTVTDPRQSIAGTAGSPAQWVSVAEGSTSLGSHPVSRGSWACTPAKDWTEGSHTVSATAGYTAQFDDGYGPVYSAPSYVTFDVAIPPAPAAPAISSPAEGATVTDVRQQVTGTAERGVEKVTLADGRTALPGEAHVTGTAWTYTPGADWAPGAHTITAVAHRSGRNSPASTPRHFSVQAPSPTPTVSVELVDPLADNQEAEADCAFTHKLDVHITENGDAVRALPITFTVKGSTGSDFVTGAATYPSQTDDNGVAPATTLYAGDTPGSFTVSVTSSSRADVGKDIHLTVRPRS
ncbi:hypothetical protein AB0A77_35465 [Streptomyces varsoviensis]|uniref:hypothetical protein n=1 Tax=Streptomyces varsoviensis TaxID=67373 RepID=UPI0033ECE6AB